MERRQTHHYTDQERKSKTSESRIELHPEFSEFSDARLDAYQGILDEKIRWAEEDGDSMLVSWLECEMALLQAERKRRNRTPEIIEETGNTSLRDSGFQTPVSEYPDYGLGTMVYKDTVIASIEGMNTNFTERDSSEDVGTDVTERDREKFISGKYGELSERVFVRLAAEAAGRMAKRLWEFGRYCKSYPLFAPLTGEEVFSRIDWENTPFDVEERESSFVTYFDKARFAPWEAPLLSSLKKADDYPLQKTHRALYDRFISLAGWLQVASGSDDIMLPQKNLMNVMGLKSGKSISNMTNDAIRDGYLVKTEKEIPGQRAARYRFNIETFPELKERQ